MQFAENSAFEGPDITLDEHIAVAPIFTPNELVIGEPMFALNEFPFESAAFEGPDITLDEHIAIAPIFTPNELVIEEPMFALNEFPFESAAFASERIVFGEHNDDAAWFNDALNQPSAMRSLEDALLINKDFSTNNFFIDNSKFSGNNTGSFWAITSILGDTDVGNATVYDPKVGNATVYDPKVGNATVGDDVNVDKVIDVTKPARKNSINIGSGNSGIASESKAVLPTSKTGELLLKGNEFYNEKSYDLALKYYEKAIDSNLGIAELWFNKGNVLYKLGRFEEAISAYDKAIVLNPKFSKAWKNKGFAFEALGKTIDAEAAFAKARELESKAR